MFEKKINKQTMLRIFVEDIESARRWITIYVDESDPQGGRTVYKGRWDRIDDTITWKADSITQELNIPTPQLDKELWEVLGKIPKKQRWCVRICTDNKIVSLNYITPAFITCLENAGLAKNHDTDRDGYTFDLYAPKDYSNSQAKTWAEQNAQRICSFGFNAAAAPEWR